MSFQPLLPLSGLPGWRFLQKTLPTQQAAFEKAGLLKREIEHFEQNIAKADTPEKLVKDPMLLKVALGAFGLGAEAFKKAYVQKALTEGTEAEDAMANRIVDPKYRQMVAAFGYGDAKGAQVGNSAFVQDVIARYKIRQFEEAVGAQDESLRLAMNFTREIGSLAASGAKEDTLWLRILGDVPLRQVMEKALGLPKDFAKLDLDRQLEDVKTKFAAVFGGDVSTLADPAKRDEAVRRFLVREQIEAGPSAFTPGATALTLLQNSGLGAQGAANLFQSALR